MGMEYEFLPPLVPNVKMHGPGPHLFCRGNFFGLHLTAHLADQLDRYLFHHILHLYTFVYADAGIIQAYTFKISQDKKSKDMHGVLSLLSFILIAFQSDWW